MKILINAALLVTAAAIPLLAASAQQAASEERVSRLIVYGNDPCPKGANGEIIVCARRPDNERYRIPKNIREAEPGPESESWARRAESLEYVGRTGTQSCSTVGPGGFTGCWEQMMRQAREERRVNADADQIP